MKKLDTESSKDLTTAEQSHTSVKQNLDTTPDTEWERIVGKFWESEVPVEDEYGGDKAGWLKNSPIAKFMLKTLSSRDTYWKERVRKEVNEISRHWIEEATRNPDNFEVRIKLDALDTLLDNLK